MVGTLTVQNLQGPASGANANKIIIPSGHTLDARAGFVPPAGSIIQVVQATLGSTESFAPSTGTYADSSLTASITPTSTNSKILVTYTTFLGQAASYNMSTRIKRNSTIIGNGTSEGGRIVGNAVTMSYKATNDGYGVHPVTNLYLDSPSSTSSVTYTIQVASYGGNAVYVNRSQIFQAGADYDTIPLSSLTLMEIAG